MAKNMYDDLFGKSDGLLSLDDVEKLKKAREHYLKISQKGWARYAILESFAIAAAISFGTVFAGTSLSEAGVSGGIVFSCLFTWRILTYKQAKRELPYLEKSIETRKIEKDTPRFFGKLRNALLVLAITAPFLYACGHGIYVDHFKENKAAPRFYINH